MGITRRQLAQGLGAGLGVAALGNVASAREFAGIAEAGAGLALPLRDQFVTGEYEVCLNNARWHPMSKGAKQAVVNYLDYKQRGVWAPPDKVSAVQRDVKAAFAKLIHADVTEVAYVNSTTAGESLFVSALGFAGAGADAGLGAGGNIVTDALHFEGSLYLYDALRKQGVDVRVVRPRDWRVPLEDMKTVIDAKTRLVAVSQVSFVNGFEHELKPLCEVAHAHGALVYVDAVQAAGAIPIDVKESGVDAMGSASYKWLMGDMGLGFLYVRQDVLPRLKRTQFGYRQLAEFSYHAFPWDEPGTFPVEWKQAENAAGFFEIGTYDNATIAALGYSLPLILNLGPDKIQKHTQALLAPLRGELPRMGYACITPEDSHGPMVTFLVPDAKKTARALKSGKIDVSLSTGRMRISPSIYNDESDVQKLLAALR